MIAGSFNYTAAANEYNDENLFVIGSPHEEVEGITVELDPVRDIATHMRAEIERVFALSKRSFRPNSNEGRPRRPQTTTSCSRIAELHLAPTTGARAARVS